MSPIRPFPGVPPHSRSVQPPKEEAGNNIFYGCILQHVPRRYKTWKRVECVYHLASPRIKLADLFCSHSIIQVLPWQFCAVPTKLFDLSVHQDECELTRRRYSVATGGPNGFKENCFTLRQVHYDLPPPNRAIRRHDHVQRGLRPIHRDYAGRHEEHCLFFVNMISARRGVKAVGRKSSSTSSATVVGRSTRELSVLLRP